MAKVMNAPNQDMPPVQQTNNYTESNTTGAVNHHGEDDTEAPETGKPDAEDRREAKQQGTAPQY